MKPVCFFCQEYETDVGHQTILCPKLICKKCHQIGHFAMDCETFCDKFHEVKEQNNIHNSISEVEDLRNQLKSVKIRVEELEVELKISQGKLAFHTGQKNELKKKVPGNWLEELDVELEISQGKLALHTGQKNELKKKVPGNWHELKSQKIRQVVEKSRDDRTNELASIKQEFRSVEVTNQEVLQKIQDFEMRTTTFANNGSLDRNLEIKVEDETTLEIQENKISTKMKMKKLKKEEKMKMKMKLKDHVLRHGPWAFKAGKLSGSVPGGVNGGVPRGAPTDISIPPPMNTPPPSLPGIMRPPPGIPPFGAPGVPFGMGPPQGLPPNMMGQLRPGIGLPMGHPHMMGPPMGPPPMGGMPLGPLDLAYHRMIPPNMNLRPQ